MARGLKLILICLLFEWGSGQRINADASSNTETSTLYINKHFEVRDLDTPTKYVWNGETRVARVTGSISTRPRIQLLRVNAGWNLRTLAVAAVNAGEQLWQTQNNRVTGVLKWSANTASFLEVASTDALAARTVLWLRAVANTTLAVIGEPRAPPLTQSVSGGDFVPSAGTEPYVPAITTNGNVTVWIPFEGTSGWTVRMPSNLANGYCGVSILGPGDAVFIRTEFQDVIQAPDTNLVAQFYHTDHLRSATCMSDSRGRLAELNLLYPFGGMRHHQKWKLYEEAYEFAQKERDRESGMDYFESRFYGPLLNRFLQVDAAYEGFPKAFLGRPQEHNPYAYCAHDPVRFFDPNGFKRRSAEGNGNKAETFMGVSGSGALGEVKLGERTRLKAVYAEGSVGISTSGVGAQYEVSSLRLEHEFNDRVSVNLDKMYTTGMIGFDLEKGKLGATIEACLLRGEVEGKVFENSWGLSLKLKGSGCLGLMGGVAAGTEGGIKLGILGFSYELKLDPNKFAEYQIATYYPKNFATTERNAAMRQELRSRGIQVGGGFAEHHNGVGILDYGSHQSRSISYEQMKSE